MFVSRLVHSCRWCYMLWSIALDMLGVKLVEGREVGSEGHWLLFHL